MYGEKQEETEELKLDLQDIKNMYKAQVGKHLHRSLAWLNKTEWYYVLTRMTQ